MTKNTLLASAPTLEDARKAVTAFFCGDSKTLVPVSDDEWKIVGTHSGNQALGCCVRRKRNRYHFLMT